MAAVKLALFVFVLLVSGNFSSFSFETSLKRMEYNENIVLEARDDCEYTEEIFRAIREQFSCEPMSICPICSLCCENFQDDLASMKNVSTDLKLLCHSGNTISTEWSLYENNSNIVYLIELFDNSTNFLLNFDITKNNYTRFSELEESTEYVICLSLFSKQGQLGERNCNNFQTHNQNYKSDVISKAWIDNVMYDNKSAVEGVIKWLPGKDQVCAYEITVFSGYNIFWPIEAEIPNYYYAAKINDMEYDTNYSVKIINYSNRNNESDEYVFTFLVPSCMDFHNSLKMCVPHPPTHIEVKEEVSKASLTHFKENNAFYDVTINWALPKLMPDYYIINITNATTRDILVSKNISGNGTTAILEKVVLSKFYKVIMSAGSIRGLSEPVFVNCEIEYPEKYSLLWIILAPILSLIFIIGLIGLIYQKHEKIKLANRRRQYFEELEEKAPKEVDNGSSFTIRNENDPYEIIAEKVLLFEILGEGAFGIVRKGWIPDYNKEVAVKMLKDDPSAEEVKQFRQEIDMMKSVGSHAHIVSLVGCCTCPSSTMMLIVEYCTQGDLQNYLRVAWDKISSKENSKALTSMNTNSTNENEDFSTQIKYAELIDSENSENNSSDNMNNFIVNKVYDLEQNVEQIKESNNSDITPVDLLSFARQIAMGMEFLSSNKVIHRDLAARNVLVCANKTVKIADFGLSRDIYQENIYRKRSSGKLPIKWMALESLTHQLYTTQSDVWSYGILLWEIVTLGGNPYPSIPTGKLLKLLLSGYRMECPTNCSSEIYDLMMLCWRTRPKDRPNFTEIRQKIDSILANVCPNSYLNLDLLDEQDDVRRVSSKDLRNNINYSHNSYEKSESERYIRPITMTKNNLTSSLQLRFDYKTELSSNNNHSHSINGLAGNNLNSLSHQISYPFCEKNSEEKLFYSKENGDTKNMKTACKSDHQAVNFYRNANYYPSQNFVLTAKLNKKDEYY